MVMQITMYRCQVCGKRYDDYNSATMCENSGNMEEPDEYKYQNGTAFQADNQSRTWRNW